MGYVAQRTCSCVNWYCSHHQALRAQFVPLIYLGQVTCWRCGERIGPTQPWDLGHDDDDPMMYRGPECRPCNRSTSKRRKDRANRWAL